jgi:hypothetical protein
MKYLSILFISFLVNTQVQTIWDIQMLYGTITEVSLQHAINDAISHRAVNPNEDIILNLGLGTFYLNGQVEFKNMNESGTG